MTKPKIRTLVFFSILLFLASFLYLDYKKNPVTYIIWSKKIELISYLFFKDLPAIYPRYDAYSIKYQLSDADKGIDSHFTKGNGYFSILDLESIYRTGIPQKLRKTFDGYAKLDPNKKANQEIIKNIVGTNDAKGRLLNLSLGFHGVAHYDEDLDKRVREYINLFSKKFMVAEITQYKEDEQCGGNSYDVEIIFDSNPAEVLTIGLKNSGEICFIWDGAVGFPEYKIKNLKEYPQYQNYWLSTNN